MGQETARTQSNSQMSDFGDQVEHIASMSEGPQEKLCLDGVGEVQSLACPA